MQSKKDKKPVDDSNHESLYTLEISLISGFVASEFARKNPKVSRTVEIKGTQTLEKLHNVIFNAFDRYDDHMYEFQFGKKPQDPHADRYVHPLALEHSSVFDSGEAGVVTKTTLDSLQLKVNQSFYYWFDFGDDWWHQIKVVSIQNEVLKGRYPKIIARVGESPPQYEDWDEEQDQEE